MISPLHGTGIGDDGGIAVLTPGMTIVDQVGQSYERAAKTTDTDDNATDFALRTPAGA